MKKHAKQKAEQVYQPSDAISVLAIAATAIILVLSLFAMERLAGVPVSVRGESASAPSDSSVSRTRRRPATVRQSQAARRAAARKARTSNASGSASSSSSACSDHACSNLISSFQGGDPTCMKHQQCVDAVYALISQTSCNAKASCRSLLGAYGFFYANQQCVTSFTAECRAAAQAAVRQ